MKLPLKKSSKNVGGLPNAVMPGKSLKTSKSSKPPKTSSGGGKSFTLLVGDEGAILIFMQGNTLLRRLFAASPQPDHIAPILDLLRSNPKVKLSILADVIDQQYVRHTFPPVSSMSIAGLVKRRIERDFKPEDLKQALSLGREADGRKEWQYLIISLANTPLIQQWIETLIELPNPMGGVYLLPVEMQALLPTISKAFDGNSGLSWKLVVTHNKVSGFRQVVVNEGKLAFTRVSQAVDDAVAAVVAGSIEQELMGTIEYLRRLNFKDNEEMELTVIAAQEVVDALDLKRFGFGIARAVTPLQLADALHLKQVALTADRFGDVAVAAALSSQRKRVLRFATRYMDQLAQLYKAQLGVVVGAALITLGLLAVSVMALLDMMNARQDLSEQAGKMQEVAQQITVLQKAIDGLDKNVAYKALITATYEKVAKDQPTLNDFASKLAAGLGTAFYVEKIDWSGKLDGLPTTASNTTAVSTPSKSINVDFTMDATTEDPDGLTKQADGFLAQLKLKMPDYDITAAPYPWTKNKPEAQQISIDANTPSANRPVAVTVQKQFSLVFNYKSKNGAPGMVTPLGGRP